MDKLYLFGMNGTVSELGIVASPNGHMKISPLKLFMDILTPNHENAQKTIVK